MADKPEKKDPGGWLLAVAALLFLALAPTKKKKDPTKTK